MRPQILKELKMLEYIFLFISPASAITPEIPYAQKNIDAKMILPPKVHALSNHENR